MLAFSLESFLLFSEVDGVPGAPVPMGTGISVVGGGAEGDG